MLIASQILQFPSRGRTEMSKGFHARCFQAGASGRRSTASISWQLSGNGFLRLILRECHVWSTTGHTSTIPLQWQCWRSAFGMSFEPHSPVLSFPTSWWWCQAMKRLRLPGVVARWLSTHLSHVNTFSPLVDSTSRGPRTSPMMCKILQISPSVQKATVHRAWHIRSIANRSFCSTACKRPKSLEKLDNH